MIVACGQMQAITIDQADRVWPVVERLARQAGDAGADMLLLPETTYPAYWLESPERYFQDDIERSDKVIARFAEIARRFSYWVTAGFVEEKDGQIFNSAVVLDSAGKVRHIARKSFLWDCDNRWFAPGDSIKAFDTDFGRMGVLICADARAPEIAATLVADGATMLLLPTAWVNAAPRGQGIRNVHPEFLIRARAMEFGVPIACASKSDQEGEYLEYVGQSRIVDASGDTVCEAPPHGETLIVGQISPGRHKTTGITLADLSRLNSIGKRFDSAAKQLTVRIPDGMVMSQLDAFLRKQNVRVVSMAATDLKSFVPARIAALDGAQVVIANKQLIDTALVRARAAENRLFVITGLEKLDSIVAPDGSIKTADHVGEFTLAIHEADVKQFTPTTDLWEQRRTSCYRLLTQQPSTKPEPTLA